MGRFGCTCGVEVSLTCSPNSVEGYMFYEGDDFDDSPARHWIRCPACDSLWIQVARGVNTYARYVLVGTPRPVWRGD